jgi:predicted RNA-binding protein YlxR (DUF448 family)
MSKQKLRQRSCIACRGLESWTDLIRTVLVNNHIEIDLNHRMPGRGAWLHRKCIMVAIERKAFNKSFNYEGEIKVKQLEDYLKNLSDY